MKTTFTITIPIETSTVEEIYCMKEKFSALLFRAGYNNAEISFGEIDESTDVVVPESFGMFSKAGNKLLISIAKELVEKMLETPNRWQTHFNRYINKYKSLCVNSKHKEMSDTDVRDQVFGFLFEVSDKFNSCLKERQEKVKFLADYRIK